MRSTCRAAARGRRRQWRRVVRCGVVPRSVRSAFGVSFLVIGRATDVGVHDTRPGRRLVGVEWQAIETMLENRIDVIRAGADGHGAPTRRLDALRAVPFRQPQQPETGPIALLGVWTAREDLLDERFGLRSHGGAPPDQAGRTPLEMGAMSVRHVL